MASTTHRWSQDVTDHGNGLDLKAGVFTQANPRRIAESLKDCAEHSDRRHGDPYRSAMSMLTSSMNHAGAQLQPGDKTKLEKAKDELRHLFQKPSTGRTTTLGRRVEKPGSGRQGGPSGQTDATKHDRKHTNK